MVLSRSTIALAAIFGVASTGVALGQDNQEAAPAVAPEATTSAAPAEATADPVTTGANVAATAKPAEEEAGDKFPISASLGVTYRFNHANVVETEGDANFGYHFMWLDASVGYDITDAISVGAALGVEKELSDSYDRAPSVGGSSSRTIRQTQLRDVSLYAGWAKFATIPVVDISFSADAGLDFPTSKASEAAGTLLVAYPSLSASWKWQDLGISAAFVYFYYLNENPTVQIDCEAAPQNCVVAGKDTGNPNALHTLLFQTAISYKIIDALSVSAGYLLTNSYGAAEFPNDEFTSEYAQSGTQAGVGSHGTDFKVTYKVFENTSISAAMGTRRSLYTNDGKDRTQPFFDTDSNLHHRTYYYFTLAQSI